MTVDEIRKKLKVGRRTKIIKTLTGEYLTQSQLRKILKEQKRKKDNTPASAFRE